MVVYGSTPAGIAASVAASRLGLSVALFEPLPMIGGMGAAGNLGLNDGGQGAERTSLAAEWAILNGRHYGVADGVGVAHPESFVGEASFWELLRGAGVSTVEVNCRLLSATTEMTTTTRMGEPVSRVHSVDVLCATDPVTAAVFIDASYDGDVLPHVDVEYASGRESIAHYNESLAGARRPSWDGVRGPRGVNALRDDGSGAILKYVRNISELAEEGEADDALMAFQHRLCISGDPNNTVPWPKPEGYDADDFVLLQRALDANADDTTASAADFFTHMPPARLPGLPSHIQKYCLCCGTTVASSDQPDINGGWASASWEERQDIHADHTYFELGSFYYLSNSPLVPEAVRDNFNRYGLCRDEFADYGHVPPQLYVRISNRLVGEYVLTQNNMTNPRSKPDGIAVGDWWLDQHMTGKYAVPVAPGRREREGLEYEVMLEGVFWPNIAPECRGWYDLPYAAMVPKRGTGSNLLVPVALSASAVAYSSSRIENMFMSAGTAAGVAARQLVAGDGRRADTVQDVDVGEVRAVLRGVFKQRVSGPPGSGDGVVRTASPPLERSERG